MYMSVYVLKCAWDVCVFVW